MHVVRTPPVPSSPSPPPKKKKTVRWNFKPRSTGEAGSLKPRQKLLENSGDMVILSVGIIPYMGVSENSGKTPPKSSIL